MDSSTSDDTESESNRLSSLFKSHVTHVVVEFVHEKTENGKASIEVVPREWLDRVDNQWICYYPPKKDWPKVDHWTKISKCRDRLWKGSQIDILKEAANYEKGIRLLKKFFVDDVVLSTGEDIPAPVEIEKQNNHLKVFNATESQFQLQNLPAMIPNDSAAANKATVQELARVDERPINSPAPTGKKGESSQRGESGDDRYDNDNIGRSITAADLNEMLATVISQVQLSEKRILREIDGAKRSTLYDIQARADEVKNTVLLNGVPSLSTDIYQHIEGLGFALPFKTVEDFEAFDAVVAADAEKRKSLECIMTKSTIGNKEFSTAMSGILSNLLGKEVQLQYSACGREMRGTTKKKSFVETQTFKCLDAVLTEKYSISTKSLTSKMSRWFIGAGDRDGGRKRRK